MKNLVVVEKTNTQNRRGKAETVVSKGTLTRIIDRFESANPIKDSCPAVIKDYVYIDQKRLLA